MEKSILYINACVRKESRTKKLTEKLIAAGKDKIKLMEEHSAELNADYEKAVKAMEHAENSRKQLKELNVQKDAHFKDVEKYKKLISELEAELKRITDEKAEYEAEKETLANVPAELVRRKAEYENNDQAEFTDNQAERN